MGLTGFSFGWFNVSRFSWAFKSHSGLLEGTENEWVLMEETRVQIWRLGCKQSCSRSSSLDSHFADIEFNFDFHPSFQTIHPFSHLSIIKCLWPLSDIDSGRFVHKLGSSYWQFCHITALRSLPPTMNIYQHVWHLDRLTWLCCPPARGYSVHTVCVVL